LGGAYAKTQSKDNWQKTALKEREKMNKEYWQAKVNLCRQVGIEQLMAGDIPNGTRNLKRMVRAMEELNLLKAVEDDRPAEDMWASLITNGLLLAGEGESNE
jgi:hypothetical protein